MATDHCVTKVSQVINSPLPSPDQYFQNKFQATRNGQKLISHCDNYFLSDQMAHFVNHLFSSSIFNILVPPKFLNYPYIVTFNCPAIFSILSFLFNFNFFTFYASSIQLHSHISAINIFLPAFQHWLHSNKSVSR